MKVYSRKLSRAERKRRYHPMLERWVAAATDPTGSCTATGYGISRSAAERDACRKATALARAHRTLRVTSR